MYLFYFGLLISQLQELLSMKAYFRNDAVISASGNKNRAMAGLDMYKTNRVGENLHGLQ